MSLYTSMHLIVPCFHIIYGHSTSPKMLRVCICFGVHEHQVSNGTCCKPLDMTY